MSLETYRQDMETCCRCSACKFIPLERVKGFQYVNLCPSIARYNFHAYSGGGRLAIGVALLERELEYSDKLLEVVYNCQMCGGCDISCKYAMDMEVLDPLHEIRVECVKQGRTIKVLDQIILNLRQNGSMVLNADVKQGDWSEGLKVKDFTQQKVEVIFHVGCRIAFDPTLWKIARSTLSLIQKAGIEVGIAGSKERCCGGRAFEMGYEEDFLRQANFNMERIRRSGATILVTACAECYQTFKVLYDKFKLKGELKVYHTTEFFSHLIQAGKLNLKNKIDLKATYHDPCHLGRLGEPYIHWDGKQIPGHIRLFDPPKEFRRGSYGVYEPPREVLGYIPGLKLIEMTRTKEYAWCCGAGGGVREYNPEFARWTARERIKEVDSTGVDGLITACPGCEKIFSEVLKEMGSMIHLYDVVELIDLATQ